MSLLLDTDIVYAYYDRSDAWHPGARAVVQNEQRGLILQAPVVPAGISSRWQRRSR